MAPGIYDYIAAMGREEFSSLEGFQAYFGLNGNTWELTESVTFTGSVDLSTTMSRNQTSDPGDTPDDPGPGTDPGTATTPEPGTMLLLGSALRVAAWRRRRKNF